MTAKKAISKTGPVKNDGKAELIKIRSNNKPKKNAVKKVYDHQLAIDELTAKLDELEDLRTSFCRIFEICEVKK